MSKEKKGNTLFNIKDTVRLTSESFDNGYNQALKDFEKRYCARCIHKRNNCELKTGLCCFREDIEALRK